MRVRFATVDEDRNGFVRGDSFPLDDPTRFAEMRNECSSQPDEPGDTIADLLTDDGDILDVCVMNRQMRERAERILNGK